LLAYCEEERKTSLAKKLGDFCPEKGPSGNVGSREIEMDGP
jgi:hypothetical protein